MSRKSDDSIEKFFRKAVRQSDTTFRESDWLDMEKRLDEQAKLRAAARASSIKRMATVATGTLLLSLSLYWMMPGGQPEKPAARISEQALPQASPPDATGDNLPGANTGQPATEASATPPAAEPRHTGVESSPSSSPLQPAASLPAAAPTATAPAGHQHAGTPPAKAAGASPGNAPTAQPAKAHGAHTARTPAKQSRTTTAAVLNSGAAAQPTQNKSGLPAAGGAQRHTANQSTLAGQQNTIASAAFYADKPAPAEPHHAGITQQENTVTPVPAAANKPAAAEIHAEATTQPENVAAAAQAATGRPAQGAAAQHQPVADQPSTGNATVPPSHQPPTPGTKTQAAAASAASATAQSPAMPQADTVAATEKKDSLQQKALAEKSATEAPGEKPLRVRMRWNAALVVAPDFSSTGSGEMSTPGQAFGVMIGYRLFSRFTISSGVLRSSKQYEGYGADYKPPAGYWEYRTNGVVPAEIKGRCSIIEVPVIVQYDVRQSARARLFISGGVSSYFMRSESYDYFFDEPNEGADQRWATSEPSSYAFKVGHFSAAYELRIKGGLSVGIEPYIKIPFQGIGWANISLYTTGAYVNVRYYFSKKGL